MKYAELIKYELDCIPIIEAIDFLKDFDGNKADRVCCESMRITKENFDKQLDTLKNWSEGYKIAYKENGEQYFFSSDVSSSIISVLIGEIENRKNKLYTLMKRK